MNGRQATERRTVATGRIRDAAQGPVVSLTRYGNRKKMTIKTIHYSRSPQPERPAATFVCECVMRSGTATADSVAPLLRCISPLRFVASLSVSLSVPNHRSRAFSGSNPHSPPSFGFRQRKNPCSRLSSRREQSANIRDVDRPTWKTAGATSLLRRRLCNRRSACADPLRAVAGAPEPVIHVAATNAIRFLRRRRRASVRESVEAPLSSRAPPPEGKSLPEAAPVPGQNSAVSVSDLVISRVAMLR